MLRLPAFASRGSAHQLCDPGEVTSPLCVPVSLCVDGENNSTYPTEVLCWFNELIYVKRLEQCLARGKCSINISYHYFYIQCLD